MTETPEPAPAADREPLLLPEPFVRQVRDAFSQLLGDRVNEAPLVWRESVGASGAGERQLVEIPVGERGDHSGAGDRVLLLSAEDAATLGEMLTDVAAADAPDPAVLRAFVAEAVAAAYERDEAADVVDVVVGVIRALIAEGTS